MDLPAGEVTVRRWPTASGYSALSVKRGDESLIPEALPEVVVRVDDVLGRRVD